MSMASVPSTLSDRDATITVEAELYRRRFREFARAAWQVVEPSRRFLSNWHVDAITDHLQAVAERQIQYLLINIPPGHAKSLIVAVMFPAWVWAQHKSHITGGPKWRSLFGAYAQDLSIRDSRRCRELMENRWYIEHFRSTPGPDGEPAMAWRMATDQNVKGYYENTEKGFRIALSVSGKGTGFRGDLIACFPFDAEIDTDAGRLPIGRIVEDRMRVRVLAFDHKSGMQRWQPIEEYETHPGRPSVRVTLSSGRSFVVTEDHPIYTVENGYTHAQYLRQGDRLVAARAMPGVRVGGLPQTITPDTFTSNAVQHEVCRDLEYPTSPGSLPCKMLDVRRRHLPTTNTSCESGAVVLQSQMCGAVACRGKQSRIPRRARRIAMRRMRRLLQRQVRQTANRALLLGRMPGAHHDRAGQPPLQGAPANPVSYLRQAGQGAKAVLFAGVRECCASFRHGRQAQSTLHSRRGERIIPSAVSKAGSEDSQARRLLPAVPQAAYAVTPGARCSPYRLPQGEQRTDESDLAMPSLPRNDSRDTGTASDDAGVFVVSVERTAAPERVYNIRVHADHNYFANGLLVHNCDDPINAKDQYSDSARRDAIFWWEQVMSSRLNDLATGSKVVIMQRLHAKDLSGHLLEQGGYEHLNLPSEYEPERRARTFIMRRPVVAAPAEQIPTPVGGDGAAAPLRELFFEDPRVEYGELLFQKLFPKPVLVQAKKDLGSTGYAGQHQQRPSAEEGSILKRHWWKYWQPVGANLPPVSVRGIDPISKQVIYATVPAVELDLATLDEQMQSWDCSFKDEDTSDYVVGGVFGRRDADKFVLEIVRDRMDLPRTISAVEAMTASWPAARAKLVEDKANGSAVIQVLKSKISGLIAVEPHGGKLVRASACAPEVESGNWYLPHPLYKAWVDSFITECADFPNGANDDQVDCFSQACVRWQNHGSYGLTRYFQQAQAAQMKADEERLDMVKLDRANAVGVAKVVQVAQPASNGSAQLTCPNVACAATTAIVRVQGSWRCNHCGTQWGHAGAMMPLGGTRTEFLANHDNPFGSLFK